MWKLTVHLFIPITEIIIIRQLNKSTQLATESLIDKLEAIVWIFWLLKANIIVFKTELQLQ